MLYVLPAATLSSATPRPWPALRHLHPPKCVQSYRNNLSLGVRFCPGITPRHERQALTLSFQNLRTSRLNQTFVSEYYLENLEIHNSQSRITCSALIIDNPVTTDTYFGLLKLVRVVQISFKRQLMTKYKTDSFISYF